MKKERDRVFKSASTWIINTDKGYNGKAFYFCHVTPLYKGSNGEREKKKPTNPISTIVTTNIWQVMFVTAAQACSPPPSLPWGRAAAESSTARFAYKPTKPVPPAAFLTPWVSYEIFKQTLGILVKLKKDILKIHGREELTVLVPCSFQQ